MTFINKNDHIQQLLIPIRVGITFIDGAQTS